MPWRARGLNCSIIESRVIKIRLPHGAESYCLDRSHVPVLLVPMMRMDFDVEAYKPFSYILSIIGFTKRFE